MSSRHRIFIAIVCAALSPRATASQEADVILRNGRFWTGDSLHPRAEALAIRGERIISVGTNAMVARHRTPRTQVIDLGGRFVTPGFIDDHTHFNQAGALLIGANLLDVSTAAPLAARVKAAVQRMSPGAWLTGGDWGAYEDAPANSTGALNAQRGPRFSPDRSIIDSVSGQTPMLLNRWDRSAWLANGLALERAGLSCTQPVAGLECVDGKATGRVAETALTRVRGAIAPKTFDQRLREARAAMRHLAELGVTTIHDITPPFQLPVYHELKRRGELTMRVFARPTLDKWNELTYAGIAPGFGDDWLRIRALKGFVDGIQGNSTARFYEPQLHSGKRGEWRDSTNTAATDGPGSGMEPAGNMERLLFGLDSAGWWANVHAIGDEAIDTVLTLMEKVMTTNGPKERRWRIIHSQVIRNAAVAQRYKRLGVVAEVQPYHAIDDMRWMEPRIGDRARWAYAFKTFADAGVPLLFGSDWPGTNASWYTANPMTILYAATTRQTLDGQPAGGWFPEQRLDLETSLRSYTINNAWAEGEERSKGSLSAGKLADLVVLDRDLFGIPVTQIKEAKVLLTMVGGRVVHAAAPFAYPHDHEPIGTVRQSYDGALSPELAVSTFRNIHRLFPSRVIAKSATPRVLARSNVPFPDIRVRQDSATFTLDDYVRLNRVTGLLVLQDGEIRLERYTSGNTEHTRWMSMSVAKSVTATLVGAALHEGRMRSLDDSVVTYVPRLRGSAYDGVTVRDVLLMASGVRWNETYTNPASDRRRLLEAQIAQRPGATLDVMASLPRAAPPGTRNTYSTGETQVVGAMLRGAVGRPLAQYLHERIWGPAGMEADATWWLDAPDGLEIGGSGIAATLRDYGRLGLFLLDDGVAGGTRVLPAGWARDAGQPKALRDGSAIPYGYLWWPAMSAASRADSAFSAEGIHGQHLYINPATRTVIVVWSAQPHPTADAVVNDALVFDAITTAIRPRG